MIEVQYLNYFVTMVDSFVKKQLGLQKLKVKFELTLIKAINTSLPDGEHLLIKWEYKRQQVWKCLSSLLTDLFVGKENLGKYHGRRNKEQ